MKLSNVQIETLKLLAEEPKNTPHHPKDRFKESTLNALEKRGLVQFYSYSRFLHGAVRITEEGKKSIQNT